MRPSRKAAMGRYLSNLDWPLLFSSTEGVDEMWGVFQKVMHTGLDFIMPLKQTRIDTADAVWMNDRLKNLILKRQKAFNTFGIDSVQFKFYRNAVNRERKACRGKYYDSKVHQLKDENPKLWWDAVKRLSGAKTTQNDLISQINIENFSDFSNQDQANTINSAFLEPLEEYRLQTSLASLPLEDPPMFLNVTELQVQRALSILNPKKASGPDKIPNWFLKEYSYLLAFPVKEILNCSFREQRLPAIWKMADVSPLPKKKPVENLKKDLRPISLTPCVAKLAEGFVVDYYIKPAVLEVIDKSQYGAIPKSSTTMALISMLHEWTIGTDGNSSTVRTILIDYRKAFDLIDHRILVD